MAYLFYRAHRIPDCVRVFQKSPIKFKQSKITFCQNYSEERVVRSILQNHSRLWCFWKKSERLTGKTRSKLLVVPVILVRIPPFFSHKSRVLHTFRVCAPTGVYKMKGGPVVLTILLFQKILMTIYPKLKQV